MDIIRASDAKVMADEAVPSLQADRSYVANAVYNAAANGDYFCTMNAAALDQTKDDLYDAGYSITYNADGDTADIQWSNY